MASRRVLPNNVGALNDYGLKANAYLDAEFIFGITVDQIINNARSSLGNMMQDFQTFSENYEKQVKQSRKTFAAAHVRAAERAQAAILLRYDETHEGRESYRTNPAEARLKRFAGGKLRRALSSPSFFQVSYNSVGLGNLDLLNSQAPQWARLNFGAGAAANSGSKFSSGKGSGGYSSNFSRFFNAGATRLVSQPGPRPGFTIPRGFWFDENKFYPYSRAIAAAARLGEDPDRAGAANVVNAGRVYSHYSRRARPSRGASPAAYQRRMQTRGIKAHRFIDAGVYELFSSLAKEYDGIVTNWQKSAESGRGVLSRR